MKNLSDNGETQTGQSRGNPNDVAWLAGIIDGEGSFGVCFGGHERKTIQPKFYIGNTSVRLLKKVQRIIHEMTGHPATIRARDKETEKIVFTIEIANQQVHLKLLPLLIPHLTVKKEQAEEILAFCESRQRKRITLGQRRVNGFDEKEWGLSDRLKAHKEAVFVRRSGLVETEREALN